MKKVAAFILAFVFIVVTLGTVYANELDNLKQEQDAILKKIEDEQKSLQQAQREISSISEQMKFLEDQIARVENDLVVINKNLQEAESLVEQAEEELIQIENDLQERVEIFKKRLKEIYQKGDVNFFEVLTQSKSLTDFLVRFELLKKIAEQDMALVEEIDRQRLLAEEKKQELEEKRDQVALLKTQSEAKRAQLGVQKQEQEALLAKVREDKATIEKAIAELEADSQKLASRIREIQLSRSRDGLSAPSGKFAWPTPGYTRVTSDYGMRTHPVTRVRSMHTGVDIAAPLGSPAVAGEVGEVIYAGWFGAYGWTVVLDHGGGISSMYPHLSKITVKEGQIVGRGEEVGKIGSSGVSTGPHIHFEIRKNGDPINPWTYLR